MGYRPSVCGFVALPATDLVSHAISLDAGCGGMLAISYPTLVLVD
jgi:hypothetical protein